MCAWPFCSFGIKNAHPWVEEPSKHQLNRGRHRYSLSGCCKRLFLFAGESSASSFRRQKHTCSGSWGPCPCTPEADGNTAISPARGHRQKGEHFPTVCGVLFRAWSADKPARIPIFHSQLIYKAGRSAHPFCQLKQIRIFSVVIGLLPGEPEAYPRSRFRPAVRVKAGPAHPLPHMVYKAVRLQRDGFREPLPVIKALYGQQLGSVAPAQVLVAVTHRASAGISSCTRRMSEPQRHLAPGGAFGTSGWVESSVGRSSVRVYSIIDRKKLAPRASA